MTVAELIEELAKYPPGLEISVRVVHTLDCFELVGTPVLVNDVDLSEKVWLQILIERYRPIQRLPGL